MSCFTGETSVSGIEPETFSQSFGHHTKALALSFWTYSFKWVPNHQKPETHLKNPLVLAGIRTWARLVSSLTLYLLCHRAPLMKKKYLSSKIHNSETNVRNGAYKKNKLKFESGPFDEKILQNNMMKLKSLFCFLIKEALSS